MNDLKQIAKNIRKRVLKLHAQSKSSHIGSVFSCVEVVVALYFEVMNIDPKNPQKKDRDRFILSKGHAANALYNVLAERGFFSADRLEGYYKDKGLPGHATKDCLPGVEVSTGALGHGLPMGIGMAMAARYDKNNSRAYVLMSDGECDEGTTWEAALFAAHHKLDNLVAVVDYNKIQSLGRTNEVLNLEPLAEKWKSFGWAVKEIDGHNFDEILAVLKAAPAEAGKPSVIIAHTVKGKGVSFMEDKLEWHYRSPSEEQLAAAIEEVEKQ